MIIGDENIIGFNNFKRELLNLIKMKLENMLVNIGIIRFCWLSYIIDDMNLVIKIMGY